ncbi:MAG TPA: ABC transporter permease [Acidimicrobiales bacterium]|jgi:ABC-2 type transport system permease protein|nr:ABC transporter permease [Acidimicrobiales bacterium]
MTATTVPLPRLATPTRRSRSVSVIPALTLRRLALSVRSPRALAVPLLAPILFALVVAPALASTLARPGQQNTYMTYFALATAGLLVPLNCLFSGLGVIVDRDTGAMRELLVAPIRRSSIVVGNLLAVLAITALQLAVLIGVSALRGASYATGVHLLWFLAAAVLFSIAMYGLAEILAARIPSPVEYTGVIPAFAIVPFFFAGSLYPIVSLPHWLTDVARVLPLTHALAIFRYGLTAHGSQALHDIWGMSNATEMAALSLGVLAVYAVVIYTGAVRVFTRSGTS